jgi:hypothetical protein
MPLRTAVASLIAFLSTLAGATDSTAKRARAFGPDFD